jgi:hypothetical protein
MFEGLRFYDEELQKEWKLGARNFRAGISLPQSCKHIDRYEHDMRNAHKSGWIAMKQYLDLKKIDEEFSKDG